MRAVMLVLVLALLAAGCAAQPAEVGTSVRLGEGLSRVYDSDARVFCWLYQGYLETSISCLPANSVHLTVPRE